MLYMHISTAKEITSSFSSHPNQSPETDFQSRSSVEMRWNVQIAPSTCRCLVTSHIIWYGVGSCSLRFRRNPPTVRMAAASTTAVTARGTWELAAGAKLSDSPLSWMLEARSVQKRANRVALANRVDLFTELVNLKVSEAKRNWYKMLQCGYDQKTNCFITH